MACKHLIVDVGNTLMKCALFDGDVLLKEFVCDAELQPLLDSVSGIDISGGMWSAVRKLPASLEQWFACNGVVKFTWQTPVPLKNLYSTPETLGPIGCSCGSLVYLSEKQYFGDRYGDCHYF